MEAFHTHTGIGVPLRRSNVDTDQIIPAVYLKRVTRTGFEDGLFAGWRTELSIDAIFLAAGFAAVIGIFFGYYPAKKASRLSPIEALRYE